MLETIRSKDLQKVKQEIASFRRKLKIAQNDLIRAYEIAKPSPAESDTRTLELKEKRFRIMKRRLAEMEANLRALQEGQNPVKVEAWKVRRPSTESKLMMFCEA